MNILGDNQIIHTVASSLELGGERERERNVESKEKKHIEHST